jgi:hypothetical protein
MNGQLSRAGAGAGKIMPKFKLLVYLVYFLISNKNILERSEIHQLFCSTISKFSFKKK